MEFAFLSNSVMRHKKTKKGIIRPYGKGSCYTEAIYNFVWHVQYTANFRKLQGLAKKLYILSKAKSRAHTELGPLGIFMSLLMILRQIIAVSVDKVVDHALDGIDIQLAARVRIQHRRLIDMLALARDGGLDRQ